jgi:cytoskeleton protein RodZ
MMQTIGQRLKTAREANHLTLQKVFEATRIRIQYLQALEADDLSIMPAPVQARGYLRNYAEYLGLDFEQMLDELRAASKPSGEIIGPTDDAATAPSTQLETQMPEPDAIEEPDAILHQAQERVSVSMPLQTKPRAARRKEEDAHPISDPAERAPTQRSRKKVELNPEPISLPEAQPAIIKEPVALTESGLQSAELDESILQLAIGEVPETPQDISHQSDTSDNLWQIWLNRLGSVLSARMKRRTLVVKEPVVPENQSENDSARSELVSETETRNFPLENSAEIFKEIGGELRRRRELLSLHLAEVERHTRVKAHYLAALEKGAMDDLPSTVQTRGMLSNYATFLDLDVDALLLRFADALQTRHRERNPQKPARKPGQPLVANIPPIRSFIAGDLIFGIGTVVLLIAFAVWGVSRVMTVQSQRKIQPTAPSISDMLLASPDPSSFTATPTFLPVESFPSEATVTIVIPTLNANAHVQLNLVAVERTYMRVVVDGEVAFEGRVVPGNAYPFEAEKEIEVLVGSGAAIRIVYNGRDLGLMGTFGQVVNNIYRGDDIITPTPLATTTITNTASSTSTAQPTSTVTTTGTLSPTNTPVPSKTPVP